MSVTRPSGPLILTVHLFFYCMVLSHEKLHVLVLSSIKQVGFLKKERYLELLDSFNGVTETYHLTSLAVTEPYYLTLLDSFTWRYWTVSPCVTETYHMTLLRVQHSIRAVQYATTNSLNCDRFLK